MYSQINTSIYRVPPVSCSFLITEDSDFLLNSWLCFLHCNRSSKRFRNWFFCTLWTWSTHHLSGRWSTRVVFLENFLIQWVSRTSWHEIHVLTDCRIESTYRSESRDLFLVSPFSKMHYNGESTVCEAFNWSTFPKLPFYIFPYLYSDGPCSSAM